MKKLKRIPISAAKEIAKKYDYDQVVILARKVGEGSWVTTYGINKAHCDSAALQGKILGGLEDGKYRIVPVTPPSITLTDDLSICSCGRAGCMFCGDD